MAKDSKTTLGHRRSFVQARRSGGGVGREPTRCPQPRRLVVSGIGSVLTSARTKTCGWRIFLRPSRMDAKGVTGPLHE
jgi:hypothetical protein